MTVTDKPVRKMPKGGRKGGTVFPRINLDDALAYARKLVSKTHVSAQPRDVIYSGVVGAKVGLGDVRISALKQYGLLVGDAKQNYLATDLAKKVAAAPDNELAPLLRAAVLSASVFRKVFETFQGDVVPKGKLRQRACDLKVHPDEADTCVDLYVSSMVTAGLASVEGERVKHISSGDMTALAGLGASEQAASGTSDESNSEGEDSGGEMDASESSLGSAQAATEPQQRMGEVAARQQTNAKAIFNVNVTLDSSMDIEKLRKQLELLKKYGAI